MANLSNPRVIWFKGLLFVGLGLLASGLLLAELADVRYAVIFAIAVWAFCRAYYFAFYVIEHYVDPSFHYAGIGSLLRYLLTRRRNDLTDRKADDGQESG